MTPAALNTLKLNIIDMKHMTHNRMKRLGSQALTFILYALLTILIMKIMAWADSDAITIRLIEHER